jgi:uncharacterized membrane protein (Fun14 family)
VNSGIQQKSSSLVRG